MLPKHFALTSDVSTPTLTQYHSLPKTCAKKLVNCPFTSQQIITTAVFFQHIHVYAKIYLIMYYFNSECSFNSFIGDFLASFLLLRPRYGTHTSYSGSNSSCVYRRAWRKRDVCSSNQEVRES